jgi:uncharacterized coiled-coil DUF342 family protein
MSQNGKEKSGVKIVARDLEPYRRLVELQKQMIELSQQHDHTKRRRDDLREQMTREAAARQPVRRGLRHHLQRSAAGFLKRVSGFTAQKAAPAPANRKRP